jgi:hypothetical protein
MADEITYEIKGTDGMGNLTVRYSLGDHFLEYNLPWHGEGDLDEFIKRSTPRQQLKRMAYPLPDLTTHIGKKGTVDLELPEE